MLHPKALPLMAAGLVTMLGCIAPGSAQEAATAYPSRNITLIVPQAAGGPPDVIARIVAAPVSEILGKPIVIENRPGASASLGAAAVAKAPPDGYTLLFIDITVVVAPSLIAKVAYNPATDFAPIANTARSWLTLVVSNKSGVSNLKEFVALAKAKPGEMKFASSGVGSPPHLVGLAFLQATGAKMAHVPYRGTAPAVTDIVGGHIESLFVSYATAEAQANGGQLKIVAVTGTSRFPNLPAVPTFKEQGFEMGGADDGAWFGLAAPKGTPTPIVTKLNEAVNKALSQPTTRQRLEKLNVQVGGGKPEVLGQLITQHASFWSDLLRKSGIEPKAN